MSEINARARKAQAASIETITGAKAAEIIASSVFEDLSTVGFDETEASRLGIRPRQVVSVTPDDNGPSSMFV